MAEEYSKPVRLAAAVLRAAIDGKWPTAQRALERLTAECDKHGLAEALVAWCDAAADHAHGGVRDFAIVRMVPWNKDTGVIGGEVRPSVDWATRLIQTRAAGDRDGFQSLLDELNAIDDEFERGKYAVELVQSVALTIRSLPRGYARIGGAS